MPLRQPPEWAPHEAMWIGWPSHGELWEEDLAPARAEVAALARAIRAGGRGERVILVAADEEAAVSARAIAGCEVAVEPFGDIWLRDTGPIVIGAGAGRRAAAFRFNWWGGKYRLPGDETLAPRLAATEGLPLDARDWVLEGGAIDVDGGGLAVTTEQCLLNPNRNPGLSRADIERRLAADLGLTRILWLGEGLAEDHTDGHVDNLARFVGPGRVAIPAPAGDDDPNAAAYRDAAARARAFGLEVAALPSPGLIEREGEVVPASYMNFLIGNAAVVVPLYGAANDDAAVAAIGALFPERVAIGLRADHILTGGGSFHCISQQLPARSPMTEITVAALQLAFGEDEAANIAAVAELVREAAARGAQVILPPELFEGPYFCRIEDEGLFANARAAAAHPAVVAMRALATELGVTIPTSFFEADGPHHYNSLAMIGPDGAIQGVYRKSHIPDGPGYEEKFYFRPGNTGFKVWPAAGTTVGVGVCWDQWYPETARAMMLMGAELLFYPTAIGSEPHDPALDTSLLWRRAMLGHAVSNVVPVIAANRIGTEGGQRFYGHSFICDERGDMLAEYGAEESGVLVATLDIDRVKRHRAAFGFFRDRRPELYGRLVQDI